MQAKLLAVASLLTCTALTADDSAFQKTIQPFLSKNCLSCHNDKTQSGGLSLAAPDPRKPELWAKIQEKLSSGKMPPPGLPAPNKAELAAVIDWIRTTG